MSEVQVKRTICMWCHDHCQVAVHVRDGQLLKIEPGLPKLSEDTRTGVLTRTAALARTVQGCPRARAAAEWFHHEDRLRYPLKRVGERGEGKWEKTSWDRALDEIAEKLKAIKEKHGPEAVTSSSGTYRTHDEYRRRFFNLFGSPNLVGQGHICWGVNNVLTTAISGTPLKFPQYLPGVTKCILLLGINYPQQKRGSWFRVLDTIREGAKLIVIDPRYTATAQRADIWLQLRPGTDCALLMGMINVIISAGLYDKGFVEKWCYGFDRLAERARDFSPQKVAEITWVPAEKIEEAARMYATNKPAALSNMMGVEHIANVIEALHAAFILPAITGNIDVRGGNLLHPPTTPIVPLSDIELGDKMPVEQKRKELGTDRFRLLSWFGYDLIQQNVKGVWGGQLPLTDHCFAHAPSVFRAMITDRPYPVKAMISLAANPMVTMPNSKLVYRALKRLDLHVVVDYWLTPSAELADYVFPAASWLERPLINTLFDFGGFIACGEAAFHGVKDGEYDRRTDYEFWRGLGIRLGQEEYWPWKTLEEAFDYRLKPLGYTLEEFMAEKDGLDTFPVEYQKYDKKGFATPTGKVELYSTILERLGYDPLPRYEEPPESPISSPELAAEYPLILITGGRFLPMYHSEHRQIDSLRKQHPEPIMQINPQRASELGIGDGDWVWIETQRGRVRQKCRYFDGIDPRVVHAEHGWWFPELPGEEPWLHGVWESNINVVTADDPEQCNKISGGWPLRALLCKVYKVKQY